MQKGQAQAKLAIADQDTPTVHIYDARGGSNEPLDSIQPNRSPVLAMCFNSHHDTVISVDTKGILSQFQLPNALLPPSTPLSPALIMAAYCHCK